MKQRTAILVTGGAGYIGSHACKLLAEKNYLPIVFDNLSQGHREAVQWGPFVEGDLLDPHSLHAAFAFYQPKAVLHFAAKALVQESIEHPERYYRNNVIGSLHLLEACVKHGVKSFVFSSSCATYGIPSRLPLSEDSPQNPINPYGKSKLIIEKMLEDFEHAYGIKSISLRYFNAAGSDFSGKIGERHHPETHLIPRAILAALDQSSPISVFGVIFPTQDGSAVRDYIHVMDLAEAHVLALEYLETHSQSVAFNLGSGQGISVWQIIKEVELYAKRFLRIRIEKPREGDPPMLVADNRKAREILGWSPRYSDITTIIDTAWKWHRNCNETPLFSLPSC